MPNFSKSVFLRHVLRPFFNCAAFNFNSHATSFADKMMMMGFTAETVNGLSIIAA